MKILLISTPSKTNADVSKNLDFLEKGLKKVITPLEVKKTVMELHGEKLIKSLVENNKFKSYFCKVNNSIGKAVKTKYALKENLAVIETDSIIGENTLKLDEKNILQATSYGVGEVILDSIKNGAKKIVLWLGKSNTMDYGLGMAKAIGIKFLDSYGKELVEGSGRLIFAQDIKIDEKLSNISFEIIYRNSQILEDRKTIKELVKTIGSHFNDFSFFLEKSIQYFIELLEKQSNKKISNLKGTSSAGGLALPLLAFFDAELHPALSSMLDLYDLERNLEDIDYVIIVENYSEKNFDISSVLINLIKGKNIPILFMYNLLEDNIKPKTKETVDWSIPFYFVEKYPEKMYNFFYEQAIYFAKSISIINSQKNKIL